MSQKQTCITLHNCQSPPKNNWLVVPTPLKNMKVSWDDHISNTWKDKKKCSKPPTSIYIRLHIYIRLYIYRIVDMQSLPSTQLYPTSYEWTKATWQKITIWGASPVPCVSAPRRRYHSPLRVWGTSAVMAISKSTRRKWRLNGNQVIQMGTFGICILDPGIVFVFLFNLTWSYLVRKKHQGAKEEGQFWENQL